MKVAVVEETSPAKPEVEVKEEVKEEIKEEKPVVVVEPTVEIKHPPKSSPGSDKLPFWIVFLAFAIGLSLGAGIIGGVFYFKSQMDSIPTSSPKPTPKPVTSGDSLESLLTPASSASPSASPKAQLDLSKYKIQILNGSGIKGEAGRMESLLTTAGFVSIDTGNAATFDYTDSVITAKKTTPKEVITALTEAISTYKTKTGTDLPATSKYDIVINVGKSKN